MFIDVIDDRGVIIEFHFKIAICASERSERAPENSYFLISQKAIFT